jgi:hypothetical protein
MSKKHQKTPTTSVTNKKDQKKVTKRPKITGLFFITNDENELLRVLVIESCVRMGVTRRLLKKQKKNTNKVKFFWWKMGRDERVGKKKKMGRDERVEKDKKMRDER